MLSRDGVEAAPRLAEGWQCSRICGPSPLCGANGMRFGPDGRLHVAQAYGGQVSTLDLETGAAEVVPSVGEEIRSPDDLAFDSSGTMYITEPFVGRVSARSPDGRVRVFAGDLPSANGITVYQDRVFVDECRPGGRLLELFGDGRAPRVIADNLQLPNALMVGPDEKLYFPEVSLGEIWRCDLAGGPPERFLDGLARPTAVKFDGRGRLVTTQADTGVVTRVDVQKRANTTLARVRPGIDNLEFDRDGRLFLSNFVDGGVSEISGDGSERRILGPGIVGPFGISAGGGRVLVADVFSLVSLSPDGGIDHPLHFAKPGFPGFLRGVAAASPSHAYGTVSAGNVVSCNLESGATSVVAEGLEELYGVAVVRDGRLLVAEGGTGRLLRIGHRGDVSTIATGLGRPAGVAAASDGSCFVSDRDGGRVLHIGADTATVLDGLGSPQGVAVHDDELFVLDALRKELIVVSLSSGSRSIVARELPVGFPPGTPEGSLPGIPELMPGPLTTFAGLTVAPDGAVYVAGDAEGSVLEFRRESLQPGSARAARVGGTPRKKKARTRGVNRSRALDPLRTASQHQAGNRPR